MLRGIQLVVLCMVWYGMLKLLLMTKLRVVKLQAGLKFSMKAASFSEYLLVLLEVCQSMGIGRAQRLYRLRIRYWSKLPLC